MIALAGPRPWVVEAVTEAELEAWGERIGALVATPVFLALRGELGAGKSVLARAIARGAGVAGEIPSPTFNLLYRYTGGAAIDVVHMDLYRLERPSDVWELGWSDLGDHNEIVIIEWPERAQSLLPPDRWDITIAPHGENTRVVTAERLGTTPPLPKIREA